MSVHIDWLTLVVYRQVREEDGVFSAYKSTCEALADRLPTFTSIFGDPLTWAIVKPRPPYSFARRSEDATRMLMVHPLSAHSTLEVSGQYCQRIAADLPAVFEAFAGSFSRVDLAVDMTCATRPTEFCSDLGETTVRTRSFMESATGETVYLGSRSSDRFVRVYRYFPPHPRAHLLRAEFQLKHAYANCLARYISDGRSLEELAAGQGDHFGFQHAAWALRAEPVHLKVASHAQSGATVAWLNRTVAPLLRRLYRESKLDPEAWFAEYVMKDIELYD